MQLNNRKLAVLSLIAKSYLKTGEPVGSKSLVAGLGGSVSSATIRNDMAELERLGLLFQPHTSAGRIPTSAGMRLYIDQLMEKRRLSRERKLFIDSLLKSVHSVQSAISAASDALAEETGCVSFSVAPTGASVCLKQIDFIKTGSRNMIFVLLTDTAIVKSVFVHLSGEITDDALQALISASDKRLKGVLLCDITLPLIQTMAAELTDYSLLFSPFFEALIRAVEELSNPEICIKGQNNLLGGNLQQVNAARALNMLHSDRLLTLVAPKSSSVNIVIPDDEALGTTALVYSGYRLSDELVGSIGVLGPYRLDYGSIIPMIEYFSSSLENMLKNNQLDK